MTLKPNKKAAIAFGGALLAAVGGVGLAFQFHWVGASQAQGLEKGTKDAGGPVVMEIDSQYAQLLKKIGLDEYSQGEFPCRLTASSDDRNAPRNKVRQIIGFVCIGADGQERTITQVEAFVERPKTPNLP